jgi:hypothetical protein
MKKNYLGQFSKNYRTFYQKIVKKLLKIWSLDPGSEIRDPRSGIRDPGSGKNLFRIPDPGVKKDTGSRIRIRNTVVRGMDQDPYIIKQK